MNITTEAIMKILHLDSSITGPQSVSRALSAEIVSTQVARHPGARVTYHDLANEPVNHLSLAHLAAFQGNAARGAGLEEDLARGGRYLDELIDTDVLVIGAPMYNFSISTQLKAWIDRVVVAGKTFRYTERGPEGLLAGKKVFLITSSGGFYSGDSPARILEHNETYLRAVLGHIGLKDVTVIRAEGVNISPEARQAALEKARLAIGEIAPAQRAA
jgi:FMN-dependent NADH-azoreductase